MVYLSENRCNLLNKRAIAQFNFRRSLKDIKVEEIETLLIEFPLVQLPKKFKVLASKSLA
ncbi:hypothetical protein [Nostoc sp.]